MSNNFKVKLFALVFLIAFLLPFSLIYAFSDTSNHKNEEAIDYLYDKGVVEGYSGDLYMPDNSINRAEFVKILIESKYPGEATGSSCFDDVGYDWYAKYVCYAKDLGIIEGYGDYTFKPEQNINLAEALKVVLETYEFDVCTGCYSVWYEPYYWMADSLGLLDSISTDVDHEVTRGEMAQFVYNVETYLDEDEDEDEELSFDDSKNADSIPNVVILEFDEDSEWRNSNGNIDMEGLVQTFYDEYPDDFDMMLTISVGEYEGLYNGWSNGLIQRYVPQNIGIAYDDLDVCGTPDNPDCDGYPENLRYIQQIGDNYSGYIFKHELGHYWSQKWYMGKNDSCYDEWVQNSMYHGHWTQLSVFGETTSPVDYSVDPEQTGETIAGEFVDNGDGTFTNVSYLGGESELLDSVFGTRLSDLKFNYMDLYAMGLWGSGDLEDVDMYTILDPEFISWDSNTRETVISGTRVEVDLDDFKNLLLEREACEEVEERTYYIGSGSRGVHENDPNPSFADNPRVAIVLIKYPDQEIPYSTAYEICQVVNYEWPLYWSDATYGLSEVDLTIDGDDPAPDCAALFSE